MSAKAGAAPAFLAGGGEMGALIREKDWAETPFGQPENWPNALRIALGICLHSSIPTSIYWGSELRLLYNDAWATIPAERHPWALGQPGKDVWPDIWEVVGPQFAEVIASGEGFSANEQPLQMSGGGRTEATYWNYSFTPIRDESGAILGIFNQGQEVTGKVRAERERAQQAEALRAMFDQAPSAVAMLRGSDHVFEFANPAYVRLTGREDLVGLSVAEALPEVVEQGFIALLDRVYSSGEPYVGNGTPVMLERESGQPPEERLLDFIYQPIRDGDGTVTGIFVEATDSTDRARAEVRLRESEARLSLALSATNNVGTWDWDVANDSVTSDRRFAQLFGIDPALAAKGASIREFFGNIHPDDLPRVRENIERTLEAGGEFSDEYRLKLSDGSVHWVLALGRVTLSDEGKAVRFPGLCFDITERKQVEETLQHLNETLETQVEERARQLRESEERSRMVLAALKGVVAWSYDLPSDRFVFDANFARIYGSDPALADAGVKISDVFKRVHPEDLPELQRKIADSLRGGGDAQIEYRLINPDGSTRWMLSRSHTLLGADGKAKTVTGVGVDITEQRQLEERLRQSQKMEAVGQLTGGIAHDFNNLLTGISGAMEMLQMRLKQGRVTDLDRYIGAAQEASKRAAALTHRLLAFSRRQTLDPRPTDVNRLVKNIEEMIRRTVGPGIEVEVVGAAGLWTAQIDPNQLENALLNLCINARDAMPKGGRITIETANKWLDERAARERDLPPGQFLSLCVTDTGTGMAPDVIDRAFDPFFTTKPIGEGTGLGLSMIYGFARQSGGQVRIYSELGQGTTMCIYLPRHHGGLEEETGGTGTAVAEQGEAGETILVVDDEPTVRMLVLEVLEDLGYAVIEAEDGASAVDILKSDVRIDLLITDIGLPGGMNGRQVAETAHAARPGLGVLFITGYAENAVIGNGPLEPGTQLLTKPFTMELLASRVQEMLGSD